MIICFQCRVPMVPDKNGVGADFGNGHIYPGDRYKCPRCNQMILYTNQRPAYDPEHKFQSEYLDMHCKEVIAGYNKM